MRIALDVSSAAVKGGSGIPVLIRSLAARLAALYPNHEFILCNRASRLKRRRHFLRLDAPNVSHKLIQPPFNPLFSRSIQVFHGMDARLPPYRRPALVATIMDLFSLVSGDFATDRFRAKKIKRYADIAQRADRIIAISGHTKKDIVTHLNVPSDRVDVVYPGYDPLFHSAGEEAVARVRAAYGLPEQYIFYVGNISVRKNLKGLIRGYRLLQARRETARVGLVMAGADRFGFESVYQEAAGLDPDRLRFLGYVPQADLFPLYAGASVFAFPSLYEGFGIPVLEAMAADVPVVASNRGALPEVCGQAAIMVDPLDENALTDALARALLDDACRSDMIKAGRTQVERFSWERCAEETMGVYEKALDPGQVRTGDK